MSDQNPYGHNGPQDPYGQPPYGQDPYGQSQQGQDPYSGGQYQATGGSYGQQQGAYGQTPFGAGTYGTNVPSWQQSMGLAGPADPRNYAHWGQRVGAYLLDGLFSGLSSIIIFVGMFMLMGDLRLDDTAAEDEWPFYWANGAAPGGAFLVMGVGVVVMIAFAFWNWGHRQGTTGSTLGKQVVGIQVVNEQTMRPIGTWMSIGRQFLHMLDSAIFYLGYLWPLWDNKRQTFADKIIGTVVVPTATKAPGAWTYPAH